jgi:hypothetical protein
MVVWSILFNRILPQKNEAVPGCDGLVLLGQDAIEQAGQLPAVPGLEGNGEVEVGEAGGDPCLPLGAGGVAGQDEGGVLA